MDVSQVDFDLLKEVVVELQDRLPLLEDDIQLLVRFRESPDLIAGAFRHMHTIKSDFTYCGAKPIADFVHHLESVLQSLREKRFLCTPLVAEAVLQSMDRLRDMALVLRRTHRFDDTPLNGLIASIEELANARNQAYADQAARHVLLAAHNPSDLPPHGNWAAPGSGVAASGIDKTIHLGEHLAQALAARHPAWSRRVACQLDIARVLNQRYSQPVDDQQLMVAVLWHDVGMLTLADEVFATPQQPQEPHLAAWVAHPEHSAQWLLAGSSGYDEAALMIRQHHQWADGRGYPARGSPTALHPGAQILACVDRFYEIVAGLDGEAYRRSALRAVFDIHGGLDTRFDALLINAFQDAAQALTEQQA